MLRVPPAAHVSLLFTTFSQGLYPSPAAAYLAPAASASAGCVPLWVPSTDTGAPNTNLCSGSGDAGAHYAPFLTPAGTVGAQFALSLHPRPPFASSEARILSSLVRAPVTRGRGGERKSDAVTRVAIAPIPALLRLPAVSGSTTALRGTTSTSRGGGSSTSSSSVVDAIWPARMPLSPVCIADMTTASASTDADADRAQGLQGLGLGLAWTSPTLPSISSGLVRLDLVRLTRHVNHHFQSEIDGHTRTYTLHVQRNVTAGAVLAQALLSNAAGSKALAGSADAAGSGSLSQYASRLLGLHERVAAESQALARSSQPQGADQQVSQPQQQGATMQSLYALLSPGNHPNHGHTTAGDASAILAAAGAVMAARARKEAAYRATGVAKPSGKIAFPDIEHELGLALAGHYRVEGSEEGGGEDAPGAEEEEEEGAVVEASSTGSGLSLLPGVTSIILTRDMDGAFIPYSSVHGITLITMLRLNLLPHLRARAYHQFVSLPLYLDMAPWNIVFVGGRLDYIDYDTKDRTYDRFVVKAYEVMEVLFNYKRTLEDFKKCGSKASNPYGFPFVSECVGGQQDFTGPCKDSAFPVPCGDGTCKSDYVSCLRSISDRDRLGEGKKTLRWAFMEWATATAMQGQGQGQVEGQRAPSSKLRGSATGRGKGDAVLSLPALPGLPTTPSNDDESTTGTGTGGGTGSGSSGVGSQLTRDFFGIPPRPGQEQAASGSGNSDAKGAKQAKGTGKKGVPQAAPLPILGGMGGSSGSSGGSVIGYDRGGVYEEEEGDE